MSSWWSTHPEYQPIETRTPDQTPPLSPTKGGRGVSYEKATDGWGIAYMSRQYSNEDAASQSRPWSGDGVKISDSASSGSRRVSVIEGPFFARISSLDSARGTSSMRREQREQLYATAPPIQKGYRSVVAMIHMMVASCCIGVGLREEDNVCSASFGNLLVIVGFTELVQAGLCVYLVLRDIGIEGEHARTCILLIDVLLWVLVAHELLLDQCTNRKLPMAASLYLAVTFSIWAASGALWLRIWQKADDFKRSTSVLEEGQGNNRASLLDRQNSLDLNKQNSLDLTVESANHDSKLQDKA